MTTPNKSDFHHEGTKDTKEHEEKTAFLSFAFLRALRAFVV